LTKAILRLAKDPNNEELQSMEAHEVERYLERNLEWRGTVAIEVCIGCFVFDIGSLI
jgi:hypothetical protein